MSTKNITERGNIAEAEEQILLSDCIETLIYFHSRLDAYSPLEKLRENKGKTENHPCQQSFKYADIVLILLFSQRFARYVLQSSLGILMRIRKPTQNLKLNPRQVEMLLKSIH